MLGSLAIVALIVTTLVYATDFSALPRIYQYDPRSVVKARFVNADSPLELHRLSDESLDRISVAKRIIPQAVINPLPDGPLEEIDTDQLLSQRLNGILLPETRQLFYAVTSISWVHDASSSEPKTTYFGIYFFMGPRRLYLTVPVLEMTDDETVDETPDTNPVIYLSDPAFVEQLRKLMKGQTNSIEISFLWLKTLIQDGIFQRTIEMTSNGEPVAVYATRPVFLPSWLINEFLQYISNRGHASKKRKK